MFTDELRSELGAQFVSREIHPGRGRLLERFVSSGVVLAVLLTSLLGSRCSKHEVSRGHESRELQNYEEGRSSHYCKSPPFVRVG